jgi:hypothetical protein
MIIGDIPQKEPTTEMGGLGEGLTNVPEQIEPQTNLNSEPEISLQDSMSTPTTPEAEMPKEIAEKPVEQKSETDVSQTAVENPMESRSENPEETFDYEAKRKAEIEAERDRRWSALEDIATEYFWANEDKRDVSREDILKAIDQISKSHG